MKKRGRRLRPLSTTPLIVALSVAALLAAGCSGGRKLAERDDQIAGLEKELSRVKKQLAAEQKKSARLDKNLSQALIDLTREEMVRFDASSIAMNSSILFQRGSVQLSPEGKKVIDRIWVVLLEHPNRELRIEGHTDSAPIETKSPGYESNWALSTARAVAVLQYVAAQPWADPRRLVAVGYGEHRPIADNSTESGRAMNRRVVVTLGEELARP